MPGRVGIVDQPRGFGWIGDAPGEREKDFARRQRQRLSRWTRGEHDGLVTELPFRDVDAPLAALSQLGIGDASRRHHEIGVAAQSAECFVDRPWSSGAVARRR